MPLAEVVRRIERRCCECHAARKLPGILVAWYPGQRGGSAVADVLFGDVNPSGRLPVTFYKETEKLPAFEDYSMQGRTYRYFDGEPLYPFGHGFSYSRFEYSELKLDSERVAADGWLNASVTVKNVGSRAGDEIVQLYLSALGSAVPRALQDLRGLERISLAPGEARRVSFVIRPAQDLRRFDPEKHAYVVDDGRYEARVGASSRDIRLRKTFQIAKAR